MSLGNAVWVTYITFDVASQIYKQTILPVFEYGGFLIKGLNKDKRN